MDTGREVCIIDVLLVLMFAKYCRYGIYNCLMEAAMQEGYRRCSCYPGYLRASNKSCQGESMSCFKDVLSDLGTFVNTKAKNKFVNVRKISDHH